MLFEKVEKRRIITYFKTSTVDVGKCIQHQQHSEVVAP